MKLQVIAELALLKADDQCLPMGEQCFHPQYGLIDLDSTKRGKAAEKTTKTEFEITDEIKTPDQSLNSLDSDILDCREGQFFDIFCGKAQKMVKPSGFEIWVDTSSSMRNSDYDISSPTCYREIFIKNLLKDCPENSANISVYSSGKKSMGAVSTTCNNLGQNNPKRLRQWIRDSNAKHLIVITDSDEWTLDFSDLIDSLGGKVHGGDNGMLGAKNLVEYVERYAKTCQKFKPVK